MPMQHVSTSSAAINGDREEVRGHTYPVDCFQYSYINGCKDEGSICWGISEIVPRSVAVELVMFEASIRRGSAIIACPSYAKGHSRSPRQPVNAREWKAKNRPASPSFPPSNSSPQIRPAPASVRSAEVAAEMGIEVCEPRCCSSPFHSEWALWAAAFPFRGRGEHGGGQAHNTHQTHQPRSHFSVSPTEKPTSSLEPKSPEPVNGGPSRMPFSRQLP